MSSFIVKDDTIHVIVTYLSSARNRSRWHDVFMAKDESELGQRLVDLNHAGYNARYPGRPEPAPRYAFRQRVASKAAVYKAVRCLLYQASEGDVPDRDDFKRLERLSDSLADEIISQLPDYKAQEWG